MELYSPSTEKCVYILSLKLNDLRLNEGICNMRLVMINNMHGRIK